MDISTFIQKAAEQGFSVLILALGLALSWKYVISRLADKVNTLQDALKQQVELSAFENRNMQDKFYLKLDEVKEKHEAAIKEFFTMWGNSDGEWRNLISQNTEAINNLNKAVGLIIDKVLNKES